MPGTTSSKSPVSKSNWLPPVLPDCPPLSDCTSQFPCLFVVFPTLRLPWPGCTWASSVRDSECSWRCPHGEYLWREEHHDDSSPDSSFLLFPEGVFIFFLFDWITRSVTNARSGRSSGERRRRGGLWLQQARHVNTGGFSSFNYWISYIYTHMWITLKKDYPRI
jgi:hypothetical protein